jgi:hypothetical protein
MKYKIKLRYSLIILLCSINLQCFSQSYVIPDSVKRIVFLGNSITYMGQYVSDKQV